MVVARNVGKAVRLFCLKCEQGLVTGGEASQVIDTPTVGQQQNVTLANLLHYLSSQMGRVIANMAGSLPVGGASVIASALEHTDTLTRGILAPLLASINDAVESILLTMHDDPEFRECVYLKLLFINTRLKFNLSSFVRILQTRQPIGKRDRELVVHARAPRLHTKIGQHLSSSL